MIFFSIFFSGTKFDEFSQKAHNFFFFFFLVTENIFKFVSQRCQQSQEEYLMSEEHPSALQHKLDRSKLEDMTKEFDEVWFSSL